MIMRWNAGWQVHDFPLQYGQGKQTEVEMCAGGWMDCDLPCDVTVPLIRAGRAQEPTVGDGFEKNHWIEKRSWWFKKEFDAEEIEGWQQADSVELCFRSLDLIAEVFLNGVYLGGHRSVHYPFVSEIRERLKPGRNILLVRLSVGLETVSDQDLAELNWAVCTEEGRCVDDRGDMRRAFLRKPQYVFGWDWSPRIATCGIMDDVTVEVHKTAILRDVSAYTASADKDLAVIRGELEIEVISPVRTLDGDITIDMKLAGESKAKLTLRDVLLCSGANYVPFEIRLNDPQLWWPNGMGAQPLYDLEAELTCAGIAVSRSVRIGVRTVELDTSRANAACRRFAFRVNGVEMFMKGGDWVPPDPLYGRITDEKLKTLIREAAQANFNALRIWGGAIYNREPFYDFCDRYGILLWHDFMFACSTYPDHLEWYRELCRKEIEYQTKRLRDHACLALFCGNNEDHEIVGGENNPWGLKFTPDRQYGLWTSNVLAKQIVHKNCPHIPYWNSSPYGGDLPQSQEVGDVHYWGNAMMNPDMAKRINPFVYDGVTARFVSEYGYIGPAPLKSIQTYLGGAPLDRENRVWRLHNNTFELKTVEAGIRKHYTDEELTTDQYLLFAGLVQSTILGYSLESFRAKPYCCGGIFWMYDDCWGEVGWTIVDYYLRRKIAYYGVKRAFSPVKLMLRREGDRILLTGANETAEAVELTVEAGVFAYDGSHKDTHWETIRLRPRSREYVRAYPLPAHDAAGSCFAVIPKESPVLPAVLRETDARQLALCGAATIVEDRREGNDRVLLVRADTYTHAVYVDTDCPCSDNYFDLLPGEERRITVYGAKDADLLLSHVF